MRFPQSSSKARKNGYHLRAFSSATVFSEKQRGKEKPTILLSVFHGRFRKTICPWERREVLSHAFITPANNCAPSTVKLSQAVLGTCRVLPNKINYERIKGWLHDCQNFHEHEASCGRRMRIPTKCIDCHTGDIVEIRPDDQYLALSYVWGDPKPAISHAKRTVKVIKTDAPQTIKDAMIVVRSLGKRYLWVDKYCIDQTDLETKKYQISNMDRVYEGADLTIVAAAGTDATSGLPGVGKITRTCQPSSITAGNQLLFSTLLPVKDALKGTKWITRGWTYQEGALSIRCLVFTELQVYFICAMMSFCVALSSGLSPAETFASSSGTLSATVFGNTTDSLYYNKPRTPLRKFADHINQYTGRSLSDQRDALNGFRGLLAKSQFHSYYGIPIAPSDFTKATSTDEFNLGFARGLFWIPASNDHGHCRSLTRRIGFPSWTWAGWEGVVEFPGGDGNRSGLRQEALMKAEGGTSDVRFWIVDEYGDSFELAQLCDRNSGEKLLPELSNPLDVEAWVVQFRFQPGIWRDLTVSICVCHPNAKHPGALDSQQRWEDAILFEQPVTDDEELYMKLLTQSWNCILLFQSSGYSSNRNLYNLLIVEEQGEMNRRIGAVTIRDTGLFESLPKKRKRIRLE